jgi:hypothetical protein
MRTYAIAIYTITIFVSAIPVVAQDFNIEPQTFYIDGSTPVDSRTRDLVDAYLIDQERINREKAEQPDLFRLHTYLDGTSSSIFHK